MVLRSKLLTVAQMPLPGGKGTAMEMQALGNAKIDAKPKRPPTQSASAPDSQAYSAHAARIAYTAAQKRLLLEGDGRTDAEFYSQKSIGGPVNHWAGRRILVLAGDRGRQRGPVDTAGHAASSGPAAQVENAKRRM